MNQRKAFLKALDSNEDDTSTRMVYADWLDEHGEHEEADRQRKWPAAKAWFVRFCEQHNSDEYGPEEWAIQYQDLIELGKEAVKDADGDRFGFSCGNNMTMSYALNQHTHEFWKNWSIITGIHLAADAESKCYFSCAC